MVVKYALEFVDQEHGWRLVSHLDDGRVITIPEAQSPQVARRRLRKALKEAGITDPTFEEKLRIPAHLQRELAEYRALDEQRALLESKVQEVRPRLAQRLLTELNLNESEAAVWLGVSHTHMATLRLSQTADSMPSGEYVRKPHQQDDKLPRAGSKR